MMGGAAHGYRRRRGQDEEACYVIDQADPKCKEGEGYDEEACQKESKEEYDRNQKCYNCQDKECAKDVEKKCEDYWCKNCTARLEKNLRCDEPEDQGWIAGVVLGPMFFLCCAGYCCWQRNKGKGKNQAMKDRTNPQNRSGTAHNPGVPAPSDGNWMASYDEKGAKKTSMYSQLKFHPNGEISGEGKDDDGPFKIGHGVYNLKDGMVRWIETGSDWHAEIAAQTTPKGSIDHLSGTYHASTGVNGRWEAQWIQGSEAFDARASQGNNPPVLVGVPRTSMTNMMTVEVPPGASGGSLILVQSPQGPMNVTIPKGLQPGQTFQVELPAIPVVQASNVVLVETE